VWLLVLVLVLVLLVLLVLLLLQVTEWWTIPIPWWMFTLLRQVKHLCQLAP
jgi:hypothetical protein